MRDFFLQQIIASLPLEMLKKISKYTQKSLDKHQLLKYTTQKMNWDAHSLSWLTSTKPLRPSRGDLEIYKQGIEKRPAKKILLLGATPELRDLLSHQYEKATIYVMDFSISMLLSMSGSLRLGDPEKEVWIKGNWLEHNLPNSFFDLIIGDLVLHQFEPFQEQTFLEHVYDLLGIEGRVIMRCRKQNAFVKKMSLNQLFESIPIPSNSVESWNEAILTAAWRLRDRYSTENNRKLKTDQMFVDLKAYIAGDGHSPKARALAKKTEQNLLTNYERGNFWVSWSAPLEDDLRKNMLNVFKTLESQTANDYLDSHCYPIYTGTK